MARHALRDERDAWAAAAAQGGMKGPRLFGIIYYRNVVFPLKRRVN
jgi:hypothetical protein